MALPATATTSQEALDAILSDTLPRQGRWSDEEYLWLTDRTRRLIEFTDGCIEELPVPTATHQAILAFLYRTLYAYLAPLGGAVMFSALRLRVREGKFREPDLLVLRNRPDPRYQDRYWLGADLVAQIVSPDRPERDLVDKRADYAEAGIPEYWIVDPRHAAITVLTLTAGAYVEKGVYSRGDTATSPLLAGLAIDVASTFDAPESGPPQ